MIPKVPKSNSFKSPNQVHLETTPKNHQSTIEILFKPTEVTLIDHQFYVHTFSASTYVHELYFSLVAFNKNINKDT